MKTAVLSAAAQPNAATRHVLRRDLSVWHLIFDGQPAVLRHEQGIPYVAWLLANPRPAPIHGLELAACVGQAKPRVPCACELAAANGSSEPLSRAARVQERAFSLDNLETVRALLGKRKELETLLESAEESEPVKLEARRDLEAIEEFLERAGRGGGDQAQRTLRAVRTAIRRFHRHLATAVDASAQPHPVLRPFAAHLERHLLIPSTRYSRRNARSSTDHAGCFSYEPPPGVSWVV